MVQASRSRHLMQQTNQNTDIRALNAKTIHTITNLYCVRVCITTYMRVFVFMCESVGRYVYTLSHNSVIYSMANSQYHGDAEIKIYELIIHGDSIYFIADWFCKKYAKISHNVDYVVNRILLKYQCYYQRTEIAHNVLANNPKNLYI